MKKITIRQPTPIEQLTWKHDEIPEKPVNDGTGAPGGIGNVNLNGAIRLAGANRDETAKAIRNYAVKYVYGTQTDLANAEMILGDQRYKYIYSDVAGFTLPAFTANDIIVGGTGAFGGIPDVNLNGAVRLAGANRDLTAQAVANYVNPINVYGGTVDIDNAKIILGNIGYNYIDSSQAGFVLPSFTSNDIVVGGTGAPGGIPDVDLNGANRLAGINRDATAETIRKYRDSKRAYGDKVDIDIAKSILGNDNYTYILSDVPGFKLPIFCSNNVIVGGTGASGGIPNVNLNGAVRLAGANRDLTAQAVANYVNPINVYGGTVDIDNAKIILGSTGYNYIDSSQAGFSMPFFTSNDIVVGGTGASGGIPDVRVNNVILNGANRLAGINRDATAEAIRKYRDSKRVYGNEVDIGIAQSILGNDKYTYIRSDLPGFKLPIFCSNNIIVGGTGASGGIGDVNPNGAVRLAGANRDLTAQAIRNYAGVKSDDEKGSNLKLSPKGIQFLTRHEGCPTRNGLVVMYNDPAPERNCTIGYGHLIHYGPIDGRASENPYKNGITMAQALDLLRSDVANFEAAVNSNVKVKLTQYQFDALVSFAFNIGLGNSIKQGFTTSSALKELNKGNYDAVPSKMLLWNKPAVIIGRRTDEANLFKTGNYGF